MNNTKIEEAARLIQEVDEIGAREIGSGRMDEMPAINAVLIHDDKIREEYKGLVIALRNISRTFPSKLGMNGNAFSHDPNYVKMRNNHMIIAQEALAKFFDSTDNVKKFRQPRKNKAKTEWGDFFEKGQQR
jgi:hypothetical protein